MQAEDKRLLEMAAKAAGYRLTWKTGYCKGGEFRGAFIDGQDEAWNPLADDGDALRLAVRLRIMVDPDGESYAVATAAPKGRGEFTASEKHRNDPYAATRRAIVRAAAAIGEAMP